MRIVYAHNHVSEEPPKRPLSKKAFSQQKNQTHTSNYNAHPIPTTQFIIMSSPRDLFVQQFKSTSIEQLVGPTRTILSLEPTETISEVIKKLQQKDIRSAPVLSSSSSSVESQKMFVDFIDIVAFVVDTYQKNDAAFLPSTIENVQLQESIMSTPVSQVANYSKLDKFATLSLNATAFDAVHELAQGNKRVVVENDNKEFVNIVTHSDVMNLMKQTIDDKGSQLFDAPIDQLNVGLTLAKESIVTEDKKAIDAFRLMRENQASFVPVIGDDKQLISVISARDIHVLALGQDGFKMLNLPVLDFLSTVRQLSPIDKYPFIFCFPNSTIDLVVKRLKATRVNRLIIINEDKYPIGKVAVTHLAQYIVSQKSDSRGD